MPTLHTQFISEGTDGDGNKVSIEPKVVLTSRGPIIQITLGIADIFAQQLIQQNEPVPEPIAGWALIGTGASATCIDEVAAQRLRLPVIDKVNMSSASHGSTEKNVYPVKIQFAGIPIIVNALKAIEASLDNQGLLVLLGRDILQNFTLFDNGIAGQITISL